MAQEQGIHCCQKKCRSQQCFPGKCPWKHSLRAQSLKWQKSSPAEEKWVSLPGWLAGCIGLLCRWITVRAKTGEVLGSGRLDLRMEDRAGKARSYDGGSKEDYASQKEQTVGWGQLSSLTAPWGGGIGVHFPRFPWWSCHKKIWTSQGCISPFLQVGFCGAWRSRLHIGASVQWCK